MVAVRALALLSVALIVAANGIAQSEPPAGQASSTPAETVNPPAAGPQVATPAPAPAAQRRPELSPMRRGDILMARKMYREAIEFFEIACGSAHHARQRVFGNVHGNVSLRADELIQASQQRSTASQHDAAVHHVRGQLRRRGIQRLLN